MEIDKSSTSEDSAQKALDRERLIAFVSGDVFALESFIRTHETRLARIAHRVLGCRSEAEDARNTVFVRLIAEIQDVSRLAAPAAWLTRCVVNEALTRVRRNARERRLLSKLLTWKTFASERNVLESLVDEESISELQLALQMLSPEQRTLVSLRYDEGMTFQDIAELLRKPPSTIKSQLSKAIALLRIALSSVNNQLPKPIIRREDNQ